MNKHIAKKAIIMAAGIGNRMRPVTLNVPKPLVRVNGVRMIDSVINGLIANDITDISVVVGYKKEQFTELPCDYQGVKLIENPYYDKCNNISSLYVARDELNEDCIIADGDQMIYNTEVLYPFFERSGYNAVWREEKTIEWLMNVKNGIVQSCSRTGGEKGWQLFSISRWTKADCAKLRNQVEKEFEEGNTQIYWDDVPMFRYKEQYELGIFSMAEGDVVEIDSMEELCSADPSYTHYYIKGTDENEK